MQGLGIMRDWGLGFGVGRTSNLRTWGGEGGGD